MPIESEIISKIRHRARRVPDVAVGIGDDAAVLRVNSGNDLIACCDLMVEGVHFRSEWAAPGFIGRKALAVTLSDIAAMGAIARFQEQVDGLQPPSPICRGRRKEPRWAKRNSLLAWAC